MPRLSYPPSADRLWTRLAEEIQDGGGWVVSVQRAWPLRFECLSSSALPEVLAPYNPIAAGTAQRLLPDGAAIVEIHVQTWTILGS